MSGLISSYSNSSSTALTFPASADHMSGVWPYSESTMSGLISSHPGSNCTMP